VSIEHLPECTDSNSPWWLQFKYANPHVVFAGCICDRLRACEARVRAEFSHDEESPA
jgi:hypothetical protein